MNKKEIDRPFDKEVLEAAIKLAKDFHIIIEEHDSLGFVGCCEEMPTVMNDGLTEEECGKKTREAIEVCLAYMLEEHIPIPLTSSMLIIKREKKNEY